MHRPIGRPRRPERARPAFQQGVKNLSSHSFLEPVMGYLLAIGLMVGFFPIVFWILIMVFDAMTGG